MGIAVMLVSDIGWGVLPLYWRALPSMNAISVLAYRLVATLAAMVALLVAFSGLATAIPLATFSYGVQHSHYLTVSFHPISQPADPVLCDRAPAARSGARAGLCGVHGDLGRHRGVFVRRNSGVLGAVEKADAVMNNLPGTIAGLANTK